MSTAAAPPTANQRRVLGAVVRRWGGSGRWPSVRELMADLGIASPNGVNCHLKALVRKGELVELPGGEKCTARGYAVPALLAAARAAADGWLAAAGG